MTAGINTTPINDMTATLEPEKERRRIKRLIRNGKLPRYKLEIVKVKTGLHPKQHRLDFKLVSTMALLTKKVGE